MHNADNEHRRSQQRGKVIITLAHYPAIQCEPKGAVFRLRTFRCFVVLQTVTASVYSTFTTLINLNVSRITLDSRTYLKILQDTLIRMKSKAKEKSKVQA